MVAEVRVYFEGANQLRLGFHSFLNSVIALARDRNVKFRLIACYDKANVVRDFMTAIRTHQASFNVLLIDSDGPNDGDLIASVKNHSLWDSRLGANIPEDQVHFMVQVMETWFLADRQNLRVYYGQGFLENRLSSNPRIEEISKGDVLRGLETATQNTQKGRYHKTRHAPQLLSQIDVTKVCNAAPSCERLFESLRRVISET